MSVGDFFVKDTPYSALPVQTWQYAASSTLANPGEVVKVSSAAGSKYAIVISDGDGVIGTTVATIGLVTKASTQTSTVNGSVDVQLFLPGVVYAGKPKTATDINTAAKIDALKGKRVKWAVVSGAIQVDCSTADSANNALLIVGGSLSEGTVFFIVRAGITLWGNLL